MVLKFGEGMVHESEKELTAWVNGFLFVGNMPILDFLNTKPVLEQGETELLPDPHALERWLIASGMVASPTGKALLRTWRNTIEAKAFLREITAFRERLRDAVIRMESGALPSKLLVSEINTLLRRHPQHVALARCKGQIELKTLFEPRRPFDLWQPFVHAAAELLAKTATPRLRKCESCVLHFFDSSKKGSRRWCSMNLCGNKVKVAAYQRRNRASDVATV
jgi:predicted RNA-binding Zn ribbon-like protein